MLVVGYRLGVEAVHLFGNQKKKCGHVTGTLMKGFLLELLV